MFVIFAVLMICLVSARKEDIKEMRAKLGLWPKAAFLVAVILAALLFWKR